MPARTGKKVYLTFDDGPHPTATPFILEQLEQYEAKATFFCIGKNVVAQPDIYKQLLEKGHTVGNHTHNHKNGWKTSYKEYIENIETASTYIDSRLYRPPYGKITRRQIKYLLEKEQPYRIYMWDILSYDFDISLSPEACYKNVIKNIEPGSIVVFHDSDKAWERMHYTLPKVLAYCQNKGWQMAALPKE